jgi:hypothetical protein
MPTVILKKLKKRKKNTGITVYDITSPQCPLKDNQNVYEGMKQAFNDTGFGISLN